MMTWQSSSQGAVSTHEPTVPNVACSISAQTTSDGLKRWFSAHFGPKKGRERSTRAEDAKGIPSGQCRGKNLPH